MVRVKAQVTSIARVCPNRNLPSYHDDLLTTSSIRDNSHIKDNCAECGPSGTLLRNGIVLAPWKQTEPEGPRVVEHLAAASVPCDALEFVNDVGHVSVYSGARSNRADDEEHGALQTSSLLQAEMKLDKDARVRVGFVDAGEKRARRALYLSSKVGVSLEHFGVSLISSLDQRMRTHDKGGILLGSFVACRSCSRVIFCPLEGVLDADCDSRFDGRRVVIFESLLRVAGEPLAKVPQNCLNSHVQLLNMTKKAPWIPNEENLLVEFEVWRREDWLEFSWV
ncbi:hypothetical protein BDZ89DRAFT_1044115 [Hymenopellis radicata]|nr:hypothetical protein BDZ89DRAFT_1044115 [Hymenopellis radicata]